MSSEEIVNGVSTDILNKAKTIVNRKIPNTPEGMEMYIKVERLFEEKADRAVKEREENEEQKEESANNNRAIFTAPGKAFNAVQDKIKEASESKNTKTTEEYECIR